MHVFWNSSLQGGEKRRQRQTERESERQRQTERQKDRQTNKQTNKRTNEDTETDIQTDDNKGRNILSEDRAQGWREENTLVGKKGKILKPFFNGRTPQNNS